MCSELAARGWTWGLCLAATVDDGRAVMRILVSEVVLFYAVKHGVVTRTLQGQGSFPKGEELPFWPGSCSSQSRPVGEQ